MVFVQTADPLSAQTTDLLSVQTTGLLSVQTTNVLSVQTADLLSVDTRSMYSYINNVTCSPSRTPRAVRKVYIIIVGWEAMQKRNAQSVHGPGSNYPIC